MKEVQTNTPAKMFQWKETFRRFYFLLPRTEFIQIFYYLVEIHNKNATNFSNN